MKCVKYLDGVHAGVWLHPLDTVLGLVWGQFPGGEKSVLYFSRQEIVFLWSRNRISLVYIVFLSSRNRISLV